MESKTALAALGALAHETRLELFRHLVTLGPAGMPAGALAARFDLPPATLSFHLKALSDAGLAVGTRDGRQIRYAADYRAMDALIGYLNDNCCAGDPASCVPNPRQRTTR